MSEQHCPACHSLKVWHWREDGLRCPRPTCPRSPLYAPEARQQAGRELRRLRSTLARIERTYGISAPDVAELRWCLEAYATRLLLDGIAVGEQRGAGEGPA